MPINRKHCQYLGCSQALYHTPAGLQMRPSFAFFAFAVDATSPGDVRPTQTLIKQTDIVKFGGDVNIIEEIHAEIGQR